MTFPFSPLKMCILVENKHVGDLRILLKTVIIPASEEGFFFMFSFILFFKCVVYLFKTGNTCLHVQLNYCIPSLDVICDTLKLISLQKANVCFMYMVYLMNININICANAVLSLRRKINHVFKI